MISPELLRRFPFFGFMDTQQLKAVAMIADEKPLDQGELVLEKGQAADTFYFCIDGSVSLYHVVTIDNDPTYHQEYFISDINPGEIFGISALIEPYIYTGTMRANKPSRVLKIDAQGLRALCEVDPELANDLMAEVAKAAMERLQSTRIQLIAAKV
jgi:CRP-like cAMP-binding protein